MVGFARLRCSGNVPASSPIAAATMLTSVAAVEQPEVRTIAGCGSTATTRAPSDRADAVADVRAEIEAEVARRINRA